MKFQRRDAKDRAAYFAAADTWAQDQEAQRARSVRTAWTVAAAAGAIAVLEALALVLMMPLKTVVPYTLTVDRQSGYVETARGVKLGEMTENEAVTQSFLTQYVLARETFDAADLNANYQKVAAWSQGRARATYLRSYDRGNAQGILANTPPTTVLSARIKNIAMLSPTTAIVRFEALRLDAGQAEPMVTGSYSAVVTFRFVGSPQRMQDRLTNPLGFQVTDYRRDAEGVGA